MSEFETIRVLVNDFVVQTGMLVNLLKEDHEHISKNDILILEDSNIKKSLAIDALRELVEKINKSPCLSECQGNLYEKLQQYANSMMPPQRDRLNELLAEMKEVLQQYSQHMNINRRVIHANLAYIKDVFSALLHHETAEEPGTTYDCLGLLVP